MENNRELLLAEREEKLHFLQNMTWLGLNTAGDKNSEVPQDVYEDLFELIYNGLYEIESYNQKIDTPKQELKVKKSA